MRMEVKDDIWEVMTAERPCKQKGGRGGGGGVRLKVQGGGGGRGGAGAGSKPVFMSSSKKDTRIL